MHVFQKSSLRRSQKKARRPKRGGGEEQPPPPSAPEATPTVDFIDAGKPEIVKSASMGGPTPVRNRTLRFFSPDEPWDSDCSSEHSLEEIEEGDNQVFSGLGAEEYTRMLARATEAWEAKPRASKEIEREDKRYFVRNNYKVLRYKIQDLRESLRRFGISKIGTPIEESKEEIQKRTAEISATEVSLLGFEELFKYYWPNDPFLSTTKVKRYDQPEDERRDY